MTGKIAPDLDDAGAHYALLHYQAAEMISKIGYIALLWVVGQLVFWSKKFTYKKSLFIITIVINFILIVGFGYVGYLGGQIRHPEFRPAVVVEEGTALAK